VKRRRGPRRAVKSPRGKRALLTRRTRARACGRCPPASRPPLRAIRAPGHPPPRARAHGRRWRGGGLQTQPGGVAGRTYACRPFWKAKPRQMRCQAGALPLPRSTPLLRTRVGCFWALAVCWAAAEPLLARGRAPASFPTGQRPPGVLPSSPCVSCVSRGGGRHRAGRRAVGDLHHRARGTNRSVPLADDSGRPGTATRISCIS
jgi:hypothetical protein